MSIPTSNKPVSGGDKKDSGDDKQAKQEREQKITEVLAEAKERVQVLKKASRDTEKLKIVTLRDLGKKISELAQGMTRKEFRELLLRFKDETGAAESTFYRARKYAEMFNDEEFDDACDKGLTVQMANVLVTIKDSKRRSAELKNVLKKGLDAKELRRILKKDVKEASKTSKAKRDKANEKPPLRVFTQGMDRVQMMRDTLTFSTDAIARLSALQSEEERKAALKVLNQMRDELKKLTDDMKSFMKFTNKLSTDSGKKAKPKGVE